ncbi:hypothetical protein XELAEV_18017796mg [Xenopus laevis]|uniref:Uncharacterized protein n=1 Tax=Xenopus laevis TaxID=8355 RepID=A0A974HSY8_XENLA|nr:hypothetical protein XELAEV_18017796mg [Xenopus laevis]
MMKFKILFLKGYFHGEKKLKINQLIVLLQQGGFFLIFKVKKRFAQLLACDHFFSLKHCLIYKKNCKYSQSLESQLFHSFSMKVKKNTYIRILGYLTLFFWNTRLWNQASGNNLDPQCVLQI